MEIGKAYTDTLIVGERMRHVNEAKVASLAESMNAIGLQQPISVWMESDDKVHLVAGLHRLMAARKLGWDEIACIFLTMDEIDRQIWEIDENLMRAELTPTQESEHLARREELWRQRMAKEAAGQSLATSLADGRKAGPQHKKAFAADTAAKTGRSKSGVNQALKRAHDITAEARDLIRNTALDKGTFLDVLMKVEPEKQVEYVQRQLAVQADKDRREALKREQAEREREAKEARERAVLEICELICDGLPAAKYDRLIRLMDDAGWTGPAKALRKWMAPAEAA